MSFVCVKAHFQHAANIDFKYILSLLYLKVFTNKVI